MSNDVLALLKSSSRLPSPPGVALKILELARSDDTSLSDLARTIGSDPALAGRILKFINSPMSGTGRSISSLDEAVHRIGLRGVQLMALSFSLVSSGKAGGCPSFDFKRFWSRSLACAVASKMFAKYCGSVDPNEAFIIGLLSRIGQMAMACVVPSQYEAVLQTAAARPNEILAIEREQLGATHVETSVRLLQDWKLPEAVWQTLAHSLEVMPHHEPGAPVTAPQVLYAADVTATLLRDSKAERSTKVNEIVTLAQQLFGIAPKDWPILYDQIVDEWTAYGKLLAVEAGTDKSFRDLQDEARDQIDALSMATQMENQGMRQENQQLLQKSRLDGLTGVANRGCFDERLADELNRAQRLHRTVALCLLDIDHFKQFNDTCGHVVGDQVLQAVARTLNNSIRKMDMVARYGGEEFAVIAPDCDTENSFGMAERLRRSIEAIAIEHQGRVLRVTASIGVAFAEWPSRARQPKELVKAADDCLYEAKRQGRNRCVLEPPLARAA